MLALAAALMLQAAVPTTTVSAAELSHVARRAQPVLDAYYGAVRRCGARPPFKPTIEVSSSGGIIHYDQPTGKVVLYPWAVVGDRSFANDRADRHGGDAKEAYESIFTELLVAHELGHWLQGFQPERRTADGRYDNWFAEQNANRLMVAFWREHSRSRSDGEQRLADYTGPNVANPVPPPAGTPVEAFFTQNTMRIVRGNAYGWYQTLMTRRAKEERPAPSFCTLVGEWLPLR